VAVDRYCAGQLSVEDASQSSVKPLVLLSIHSVYPQSSALTLGSELDFPSSGNRLLRANPPQKLWLLLGSSTQLPHLLGDPDMGS
jgi:hypothetical protein